MRRKSRPARLRPSLVIVATVPTTLHSFFRGQIPFLKNSGFEVVAVCSPGSLVDTVRAEYGVEVHTVPMSRSISPLRDLWALVRLHWLLRRLRPIIVHSHTPKAGLLGMLAAALAQVPIRAYTIRGLRWETASGLKRRLLIRLEKLCCRCAECVLSVSHSVRAKSAAAGIADRTRIRVLANGSGNGVDFVRFTAHVDTRVAAQEVRRSLGIPPGAPVLGFVGRIVRDKGIVELAKAWPRIRENFPSSQMVLVGPDEDQDRVPEHHLQALRSDPRVHFVGEQRHILPYYAMFDMLVLPTYREGFPNVLLEAAAMEIPVVATRVTGCVDAVVDGVTGILVEPRDPGALADAIERLLADPELSRRLGQAGRERAMREFQPEKIWAELLKVYCELLTAKGLPVPQKAAELLEIAHGGDLTPAAAEPK